MSSTKGSTKDILEDQDLSLLTHDSKLEARARILFQTPENTPFQTAFLRRGQPNVQIFKGGDAFDFNQMQFIFG